MKSPFRDTCDGRGRLAAYFYCCIQLSGLVFRVRGDTCGNITGNGRQSRRECEFKHALLDIYVTCRILYFVPNILCTPLLKFVEIPVKSMKSWRQGECSIAYYISATSSVSSRQSGLLLSTTISSTDTGIVKRPTRFVTFAVLYGVLNSLSWITVTITVTAILASTVAHTSHPDFRLEQPFTTFSEISTMRSTRPLLILRSVRERIS